MKNDLIHQDPFDAVSVNGSWSRERARRVGRRLYTVGLPLAVASLALSSFYGTSIDVFTNLLLVFGVLASLVISRRRPLAAFFWWPGYLGFWIATTYDLWGTGGINSPFLGVYLAIMLVVALFVQTAIRPRWVLAFIAMNLLGWFAADGLLIMPAPQPTPPLYTLLVMALLVATMASCLFVFLKIEKEMSAEILQRAHELMEARTELAREESASSAKSTFIANVSHELRTPLGAILGFSDLLLAKDDPDEDRASLLRIIHKNGETLAKLVDDLLDISKIEAGKIEIAVSDFRPQELLEDSTNLLTLPARKKEIRLSARTEGTVPALLSADRLRTQQILINIVGNAIKYTDAGDVEIAMSFVADGDVRGTLQFKVTDTGRGLSPEDQLKIFKPFSQVDVSVSREHGGAGLGLALSRKLARLMGGDVVIENSRRGGGSVFVFRLPVDLPTVAPAMPGPETPKSLDLNGRRILVIDDTPDNRDLVCRYLRLAGALTKAVEDGATGVQEALNGDYDVVLMDIQMPVMDGLQATRLLREGGFRRPVIALTAHAMKEDRQRCLASGCDEYLTKPIDSALLLQTIRRLMTPQTA